MGLHRVGEHRVRRIVQPGGRATVAPGPPPPSPLVRDAELDAMRTSDRERDLELHPFSERNKRRWRMYVLASIVFFPLVTWVFSSAELRALWLQIPIAAAYGTYLHFCRPAGVFSALGALLTGALTQAAAGVAMGEVGGFLYLLAMFIYGAVGLMIGVVERSNWIDGE